MIVFFLEIELIFGEDNRWYLRPAAKLRKVMVTWDTYDGYIGIHTFLSG